MFETGFTNRNSVHKDCQGGIQIQYNIFQSDEYYVNLIDISNDIDQEMKIEIAQASNLAIIHYKDSEEKVLQEWIINNKILCPYILICRDVETALRK